MSDAYYTMDGGETNVHVFWSDKETCFGNYWRCADCTYDWAVQRMKEIKATQ